MSNPVQTRDTILQWIMKELKSRGFRALPVYVNVGGQSDQDWPAFTKCIDYLKIKFPKKQNQATNPICIGLSDDMGHIVTFCGWRNWRKAADGFFADGCYDWDKIEFKSSQSRWRRPVPLADPDCIKQLSCILHQCRVACFTAPLIPIPTRVRRD